VKAIFWPLMVVWLVPEENAPHSPRALINTRTRRLFAGHRSPPEQDNEVNDFKSALRTTRPDASAHVIGNAADSGFGPNAWLMSQVGIKK
jgi:hypothetical protein